MGLIERMARAIYETQDNPVPWDSETLCDWRRDYEREKARAALAVVQDHSEHAYTVEVCTGCGRQTFDDGTPCTCGGYESRTVAVARIPDGEQ
jgi:hypothetical protein